MNRFEAAPEAAMLPVEDVIELHNFVMGGLRQQHRERGRSIRVSDAPKSHVFCMLDGSVDTPKDNTGSTDTYLGVRLTKKQQRFWTMLVSFREAINTEADALWTQRTLYRLDWTRSEAKGVTWRIETIANEDSSALMRGMTQDEIEISLLKGKSVHRRSPAEYMHAADLNSLHERLQDISAAVTVSDQQRVAYRDSQMMARL